MIAIKLMNVTRIYRRLKREPGLYDALKSLFARQYDTIVALDDLNLTIKKGIISGLIGLNGSGKSTLIKLVCGIIQPTKGQIQVLGHRPSYENNLLKKKFTVVLGKKSQLWWDISPMETFHLLAKLYNIPAGEFAKKLDDLSHSLMVSHLLNTPTRNLSLGERMKCELIAAFLHSPELILLDEPTVGLDLVSQRAIRHFLREYVRHNKATVILTSHLKDDIFELCEEIVILKKGKLAYHDSLDKLISKHHSTKTLSVRFEDDASKIRFSLDNPQLSLKDDWAEIMVDDGTRARKIVEIAQNYRIRDFKITDIDANQVIIDSLRHE